MNLNQFDLNLLVALDALLRERSVTRAGVSLHLSQSAMSGALARLRDLLGDELLVPVGRRMVLTPLAEQLARPVRQALLDIRSALDTKPQFDPATAQRHISIGTSDYFSVALLADVLQRAKSQAPNVTFELRPVEPEKAVGLDTDDLDFCILPTYRVLSDQPVEILFDETFSCIAWTGNASIGSTITLDQYLASGHVSGSQHAELFLEGAGYRRRIEVSTATLALVPYLVVGTARIATIPTRLAHQHTRILPLRTVPAPVEIPPVTVALQWNRIRDADPMFRWFRQLMRDTVARTPSFKQRALVRAS
jgi:LysR family nod box-dependent transcriptional activator